MKISYNWIKQFIKIDWQSEETAALLTDLGLEVEVVEKYQSVKGGLEGIVVGHVLTCAPHPDADRLKVTTVDLGDGTPVQIVCGASNVAAGQKVPVATIGTILYDKEGEAFTIKKGKIRGQESHGMICAEDEIGLGTSHDGIMVLEPSLQPGTPVATVFKIENDEVFEIGLTPNRADAMSHLGTARDLRAGMLQSGANVELITPSVSNFRVDKRTLKIDIDVKESKLVPRYCGVTISGITVKPSPAWLQNRLKSIGLNPKNNIVDVTNYVLHELGQPLHAFDAAKISGKVIVKTVPSGTKFTALDDVERSLHEEDIMICDEKGPLCIAGVFGGKESGVSESTNAIFLESAYFNPVSVRKTAKRHQLNTDASFRFERGIDPSITEYALKRAALLIQEVAGGEITSDVIDVYPKKVENFSVFLNFNKVAKIIGQEISKDIIKKILVSLDIKVNSVSDSGLGLTIPAYRVDVQREIDVIEEILRVYGFDQVEPSAQFQFSWQQQSTSQHHRKNQLAEMLCSMGLTEIQSLSLTKNQYSETEDTIKIVNPLSQDLGIMRRDIMHSGLEAIALNINRKQSNVSIFEIGNVYSKNESGYQEELTLGIWLTGQNEKVHSHGTAQNYGFRHLRFFGEQLMSLMGQQLTEGKAIEKEGFAECAQYEAKKVVVNMGKVAQSFLKIHDIKQPVYFLSINLDAFFKGIERNKIATADLYKYPAVRRDLALLVDEKIKFQDIQKCAQQSEKKMLRDVFLFDVYQGDKLPAGKKSYAVGFILRDQQATLTDTQIEQSMERITQSMLQTLGATIR